MTAWFCQYDKCTQVALTPSCLYTPDGEWRLVRGGWRCPDHAKCEDAEEGDEKVVG